MAQNWDLKTALRWCVSVGGITQTLCFSMDEGKRANSLESFEGRQREEGLVSSHGGISLQEIHIQAVTESGAESACWTLCRCCDVRCWFSHFHLLQLLQIGKRNTRHGAVLCVLLCLQGDLSPGRDSMLLFKKQEYLGVVAPSMPGLEFWFCVLERDRMKVSSFHLSQRFQRFQQAFDSPPASEVCIEAVDLRGSVFIQILLEVNAQTVLFYSRSGLLDSPCFLQSCRRKLHFPKGIHSTEQTLRTGDFVRDCVS